MSQKIIATAELNADGTTMSCQSVTQYCLQIMLGKWRQPLGSKIIPGMSE